MWQNEYVHKNDIYPLKLYWFEGLQLWGINYPYNYMNTFFHIGWEIYGYIKKPHRQKNNETIQKFLLKNFYNKYNLSLMKILFVICSDNYDERSCGIVEKRNIANKHYLKYNIVFLDLNNLYKYLIGIPKKQYSIPYTKKLLKEKYDCDFYDEL